MINFRIRHMCLVCAVCYHALHISSTVPPVKLRFPLRAFAVIKFNGNAFVGLFNVAFSVLVFKIVFYSGSINIFKEYPVNKLRLVAHWQVFREYFVQQHVRDWTPETVLEKPVHRLLPYCRRYLIRIKCFWRSIVFPRHDQRTQFTLYVFPVYIAFFLNPAFTPLETDSFCMGRIISVQPVPFKGPACTAASVLLADCLHTLPRIGNILKHRINTFPVS